MKIAIGADHAGFKLKEELIPFIEQELGIEVVDEGAYELESSDDYPDFIAPVAHAVSANSEEVRGIVIGYSGEGEAMAANKFSKVRATVYYGEKEPLSDSGKAGEVAGVIEAGRQDNDSNVLSIGAGFVTVEEAKKAVRKWLDTSFSGAPRHIRRITKVEALGRQN
jgi:ribose 5-phosphate isomerase B